MLYNTRIYIREGTDTFKINVSKECTICDHYFCNHGFNFQDFVHNGCHGLTNFCLHISDIAITTVKNVEYLGIIYTKKLVMKLPILIPLQLSIFLIDLGLKKSVIKQSIDVFFCIWYSV